MTETRREIRGLRRLVRRLVRARERATREEAVRAAVLHAGEEVVRVERRRAEQRRAAQLSAARVLASAGTFLEVLPLLLEAVGRELDFLVGLAWLPDGDAFRLGPTWERMPERSGRMLSGWREMGFRRGEGVVGRIAVDGQPVWLDDVRGPHGFLRGEQAAAAGALSGVMVPVPVAGQTAAVLEFLADDPRPRDPDLESVLIAVGIQVGAFVERVRSQEAVREAERSRTEDLERAVAERTRELVQLNRELEAFSYSVSHDLRAPLRAVDGLSRALQERAAAGLDEESVELLARIRAAAHRMGLLIDDLLQLARVNRGQLRRAKVNLSAVVGELAAEAQEREPHRPVDWAIEPEVWGLADPHLVRVALANLIDNAFKFSRPAALPRISFGASGCGASRSYFVRDNGAGFDPAYAVRLFQPFQRLHRAEEFEGTGVGLATLQRIVHRHGGRAWAEGRTGEGACFWFTLGEQ